MILATDVDYRRKKAVAAGVLFYDWQDEVAIKELVTECEVAGDYLPGEFYRRELPCLLRLLEQVEVNLNTIMIDGFVYLGQQRSPGLGWHLYQALGKRVAVLGVAKTAFKDTPVDMAVRRGTSQRPLYVSAIGVDEAKARNHIQSMHGRDRIPALLKRVDRLCRDAR
jgi:deoxyribonuclease V